MLNSRLKSVKQLNKNFFIFKNLIEILKKNKKKNYELK